MSLMGLIRSKPNFSHIVTMVVVQDGQDGHGVYKQEGNLKVYSCSSWAALARKGINGIIIMWVYLDVTGALF